MGEERVKVKDVSDGELHLFVEEEKRVCLPAIFLLAKTQENEWLPAIMLKEPLKDKEAYRNTDVESYWKVARDRTGVQAVFLTLDFKRAKEMKFCFDLGEPYIKDTIKTWLEYLIKSRGTVAIADGVEPSIGATDIPLDIPKLLTWEI